jgi:hypothetical protein
MSNSSNNNGKSNKPQRDGVALWKALKQAEIEDDVNEVLAMSDAELDGFISANGGNPAAIRASGASLAKELLERRERNAWHGTMDKKLSDFRDVADAARTKVKLPRLEILHRLEIARNDPRFAVPVGALFQKKTAEASTDEELQALLDQIELLAKLDTQQS